MSIENFEIIYALSKLKREVWHFWYYRDELIVDYFSKEFRETSRHGWKTEAKYSRLNIGGGWFKEISIEDVPLTDEVKYDARKAMIKIIEDMNIKKVLK